MRPSKISALFAGGTGRLEPDGRLSGIFKRPIVGRITVTKLGLVGDEHCDRQVHGGPEKAVHQFAEESYAKLALQYPTLATQLISGSIGENISAGVLTEDNVHLGDVYRIGNTVLQVSQPRSPCWKINERYGVEDMSMFIAEQHITGWYYRVIEPGSIEGGHEIELLDRPNSQFSIDKFWQVQSAHRPDLVELSSIASLTTLAETWRIRLMKRVEYLRRL
jgi:MOSC domain-containing protein YiiM